MKKLLFFIAILSVFGVSESFSQQLVYKATNPNFGGDTFNYQFLLSSAQAQNSFTQEENTDPRNEQSDIEAFTENLNNQLLNQISRSLFSQQFGTSGTLSPGTFSFGSLVVEIFESSEGLVIDILDTTNGDQTQVIIPGNQ
ncbi:curli assembly protein CsgF [Winogradskyella jejuensis]|uniref:Curli production assembly/transport component CsgF n=1 Tax=Winogradskyella jejuensis TaxID=1089305 RepID=A0A1M5S2H8_9FLAO|nr:curli assembly protein CsgF [Winogradskyella jejuensis]SHH32684.1 curli production assembly/transport component CsgF [Winogradskyella jejuensis]